MSDERAREAHVDVVRTKRGGIQPSMMDIAFMAVVARGYKNSRGLSMCFHSDPGTGKTSAITQAIKLAGLTPYVIDMTRRAPEDVTGIPSAVDREYEVPNLDGEGTHKVVIRYTVKAPDITWAMIAKDPKAVILFDDGTNIPAAVQAAMLDIFLDKRFSDSAGGWVDLGHVPMLMAANYGDGASISPFLAPIANRAGHIVANDRDNLQFYDWVNSFDLENHPERLEQALDANLLTIDADRRDTIEEAYRGLFAKHLGRVARFISEKRIGAMDRPTPQEFSDPMDYAFATPRSYEFLARWLAVCEHFDVDPERLVHANIGVAKGNQFIQWNRIENWTIAALAGTLDWTPLQPDERSSVAEKSATRLKFDDVESLTGLLTSLDRLQELNDGSQDNFRKAREILIKRAQGTEGEPLNDLQSFAVRRRFEERWNEMARQAREAGMDWKQRREARLAELSQQTLRNEIRWDSEALELTELFAVTSRAALNANNPDEVRNVIRSLNRLVRSDGSRPAFENARDLLIKRAQGSLAPPLDADSVYEVRKTWEGPWRRLENARDQGLTGAA